jgi:hypothetical protein
MASCEHIKKGGLETEADVWFMQFWALAPTIIYNQYIFYYMVVLPHIAREE